MSARRSGFVKFYNANRGFGFIAPEDGGEEIFVHFSNIHNDCMNGLLEGEVVEFNTEYDGRKHKTKATFVTGPMGAPVRGLHPSYNSKGGGAGTGGGKGKGDSRNSYGSNNGYQNPAPGGGFIYGYNPRGGDVNNMPPPSSVYPGMDVNNTNTTAAYGGIPPQTQAHTQWAGPPVLSSQAPQQVNKAALAVGSSMNVGIPSPPLGVPNIMGGGQGEVVPGGPPAGAPNMIYTQPMTSSGFPTMLAPGVPVSHSGGLGNPPDVGFYGPTAVTPMPGSYTAFANPDMSIRNGVNPPTMDGFNHAYPTWNNMPQVANMDSGPMY